MINERKLAKFVKHSHRGVSGFIVALILIAVAVVGGVSVFIFTQGFISESQVTAPYIDVILIFGYDSSDSTSLVAHTGVAIAGINSGSSVDGVLGSQDAFALYLRNKGSAITVIDVIEVFGDPYTPEDAGETCNSTTDPNSGEFSVSSDGALANCGLVFISPGKEVTVYVRYDSNTNGPVALGRPIPITIVTANGLEIYKQIINGGIGR